MLIKECRLEVIRNRVVNMKKKLFNQYEGKKQKSTVNDPHVSLSLPSQNLITKLRSKYFVIIYHDLKLFI